jgi:hypothetical protein
MASDRCRTHAHDLALWLIAENQLIDYAQVRPMLNIRLYEEDLITTFGRGGHIAMDCSEAVTLVFKMAGFKDPSGQGYSGYGNTDTMLATLPHYSNAHNAHTGALVIYQNPAHVSMVIEAGADPVLFSHGSQDGPLRVALSEESTWHSGTVTFLDISTR